MEVILLERVAKLGQMGEVVRVKDGYARNFLLPKGKALRATDENKSRFENMKVQLETRNIELRGDAEKVAAKLDGKTFAVLRQASEAGQLFGSVSTRDIAALLAEGGFTVNRSQIELNAPIKMVGVHKVPVALHPEIQAVITIQVARNAEEAERLARGEDITVRREDVEEPEETGPSPEAVFEHPQAGEAEAAAEEPQGKGAAKAG